MSQVGLRNPCLLCGANAAATASEVKPHSLSTVIAKRRQYCSPLFQVAEALKDIEMEQMEMIQLGVLAPWEKRVQTVVENAAQEIEMNWAVRIAVSSSAQNGVVGMGGAISVQCNKTQSFSITLGKKRNKILIQQSWQQWLRR